MPSLLLSYLKSSKVNYGLAVNGVWGSGKTHFIEHELSDYLKACRLNMIYVSLNGVRSFNEVATQVVFGAARSWVGKVAKNFMLPFAIRYLPESVYENIVHGLKHGSENIHKVCDITKGDLTPQTHVIVFDDLERTGSNISVVELLGSIYEEFIKSGYHVVLFADESRIEDGKYALTKEKYIRRTIVFEPDLGRAVDAMIGQMPSQRKRYVQKIRNAIIDLFKKTGTNNLRSMQMILDCYADLCGVVSDAALVNNQWKVIFECLAPLCLEQSSGYDFSTSEAEEAFMGMGIIRTAMVAERMYGNGDSKNSLKSQAEYQRRFVEKYDPVLSCPWRYIAPIVEYFITGQTDVQSLQNELRKFEVVKPTKVQKALARLERWEILEEEDLINCLGVLHDAIDRDEIKLGDFLDCFARFLDIKTRGYLSKWPYEDNLLKYFKSAARNRAERHPNDMLSRDLLSYVATHDNTERGELAKELLKYAESEVRDLNKENAKRFFESLSEGNEDAARSVYPQSIGLWHLVGDIYRAGEMSRFADLNNLGIVFVRDQLRAFVLADSFAGQTLQNDVKGFDALLQMLRDKPCKWTPSKAKRMEELTNIVKKCVDHIAKTQKEVQNV